ncbi:2180_t:CDS:1, partial [Dentiscutata heterogama]
CQSVDPEQAKQNELDDQDKSDKENNFKKDTKTNILDIMV